MDRREKVARAVLARLLPGWQLARPEEYVVPANYELPVWPEESGRAAIECGSGPELAWARPYDNPAWHLNKAANVMALYKELLRHQAATGEIPMLRVPARAEKRRHTAWRRS